MRLSRSVSSRRRARVLRSLPRRLTLSVAAVALLPAALGAQLERTPELGGRTVSLGQPPRLAWHLGLAGAVNPDAAPADELGVHASLGVSRPLLNPVAGMATLGLEAYGGVRGLAADGGARLLLRVPYLGMGVGADYNFRDGDVDALITAFGPVRRGGIIVPGGLLRADFYPDRRSFALGVTLPVGDRYAGRTRPLRDHVVVAGDFAPRVIYPRVEPGLEAVLDSLAVSAEWIRRLVVPFLDQDGRTSAIAVARTAAYLDELRARLAVRSSEAEVRHFHAQLERAFALAAADPAVGRELAGQARAILLEEVLLPYNRLLGRKKRGDTLEDLATAARGRFSRWVTGSAGAPQERADQVLYAFQRISRVLEDIRRRSAGEWNDARLVWLPLQYALLPEDHDERHELEALLARATDSPFTTGNEVRYIANLQFQAELLRSIGETRDYHVLWVHDFAAVTPERALDQASAEVAEAYIAALASAVEAYDLAGTLPTFFIFLDEWYYASRRSRILMDLLEDPLAAQPRLARGMSGDPEPLKRALARLRTAAAASRVLQAEARQYGDAWLRNRLKVHVNVTNRADDSFWSGALVSTLFGYPDNIMRDHRKIAFHDVSERDPARGAAILTGMGVGRQYLGPGWEDRSLIVTGPVVLGLRKSARELLLSQGLAEHELPFALRAHALPAAGASPAGPGDQDLGAHALLLVNGTGYLNKPMNVAKALLYSLLPPGSVLKIPDSLWNSTFFGGLLTGAALRGCTVTIIAPALANAPSDGFPQMARAHELLSRFLLAREQLRDALAAVAGELRVGLYALPPDERGFASRADAWVRAVEALPPARALGPSRTVLPVVAAAAAPATATPAPPPAGTDAKAPRLHAKVQYLATPELWDAIVASPEWPRLMEAYLRYRVATHEHSAGGPGAAALAFPAELARIARDVHGSDPGARAASFALVGSQNMDYRGMFMDGEVGVLFGGYASLVPLVDLLFLEGTSTLVEDRAALDALLPPPSELKRRLGRVSKDAM